VSLGLAATCVGIEAMTGNWMATVLEDHRGASARQVGLAMSGFWGGVTIGRLGLARLPVAPRRLLVWASTATLVTVALLGVVPVGVALVGLTAVGVAVAPLFPTVVSTTADRVGVAAAGRVSGWQLLSGNGSIIVMTALLGLAVSLWGEGVPYLVVLGLAAGAAVLCRLAVRLPPMGGEADGGPRHLPDARDLRPR
jgi:fucose permease